MKRFVLCILFSICVALLMANPQAEAFVGGDADASGFVDIDDIVYIIQHVFAGFTAPDPYLAGDADCSWFVDIDDIVYLINYVFSDGPAPCVHDQASGSMVGHSECKPYIPAGSKIDHLSNEDCIDYSFSAGVLSFRHVNGAFNCCPASIGGAVYVGEDLIVVVESETYDPYPCPCLCLFDVDYQIVNLPPGQYTVRIEGLNLPESQYLETVVDLITTPAGSYCVERTTYPWVQ
jgi:hypothetical protein